MKLSNRLSALAEKATKGPWRQRNACSTVVLADTVHVRFDGTSTPVYYEVMVAKSAKGGINERVANAAIIVELVNNLPTIISALQEKDM